MGGASCSLEDSAADALGFMLRKNHMAEATMANKIIRRSMMGGFLARDEPV
jgi:hypothetical protein